MLVLDVMMPGIDGLQVCRVLRAEGNRTPILMLTARVETATGSPASTPAPTTTSPNRSTWRSCWPGCGRCCAGRADPDGGRPGHAAADRRALRIDPAARRAWWRGRELELSRTEFDLLELLARNAGIVLDHATIYDRIWGYDFGPDSKNLAVYIGYLRRKLEGPARRR